MRPNQVKTIWSQGRSVLNGWLAIPSSFSAELMASLGWDSLLIDLQHGVVDYGDALAMMQAISTTNVTPLVRVPWNDPAIIMKCLDAGAYGVICPMINSRADAERFVGACNYAPQGYRSAGPIRAALYGGQDYIAKANETIVTLAQIESAESLGALDAICATPRLDGIYIGPSDLSLSLGGSGGLDHTDDKMLSVISDILAVGKRCGVKVGIHTVSVEYAKRMVAKGFDFVTVLSDARLMTEYGRNVVAGMRDKAAAGGPAAGY